MDAAQAYSWDLEREEHTSGATPPEEAYTSGATPMQEASSDAKVAESSSEVPPHRFAAQAGTAQTAPAKDAPPVHQER